jgi:cephalosporin hydroxylase
MRNPIARAMHRMRNPIARAMHRKRNPGPGEEDANALLPHRVEARLDMGLLDYWRARLVQHHSDSYAGIALRKLPEDLRVYEHLLWAARPNVVIELGAADGGSALWFRDRLLTLARYGLPGPPRVISVDLDTRFARRALSTVEPGFEQTISLIAGDVTDRGLPARVERELPAGARCLVVEDSAHTYETTYAALTGFARFVAPGSWLVVEDGCVDVEELRLAPELPRGVLSAIEEFLASEEGAGFTRHRELELYGITAFVGGYLQRQGEKRPSTG